MEMVKIRCKGKRRIPVGARYVYPDEVCEVRRDDAEAALAIHPNDLVMGVNNERDTKRVEKPTRKRRSTAKKRTE